MGAIKSVLGGDIVGGRGASRGASGGASINKTNTRTPQSLDDRIKIAKQRMESLSNEMARIAREKRPEVTYMPDKYYEVQRQFRDAREEYNKLLDERAEIRKKEQSEKETKTFVNSYGEATKRNITSPTYERSKKRLEEQILHNLGIHKRIKRR